jgi:phosphomevalonate kinase
LKVIAPGKVLLFGAYSVLEGSMSLVVAVDRYAVADTDRLAPSTSREVRAALGDAPAPEVDVSSLHQGGEKLGLGSSAAALVATLGARAAAQGKDLADPLVRREIFSEAKRAHADAQGGGSGVDIAASTHGGALFYSMVPAVDPFMGQADLPPGLVLQVFWSGKSARTSDLLAKVKKLDERDGTTFTAIIDAIADCVSTAHRACACKGGDLAAFVGAGRANARALADLGRAADAPIVPPTFADLALLAEREGGAFYPSGAGGGDVGVWLGSDPPSKEFLERARIGGMLRLELGMDRAGVRTRKD